MAFAILPLAFHPTAGSLKNRAHAAEAITVLKGFPCRFLPIVARCWSKPASLQSLSGIMQCYPQPLSEVLQAR